MSNLPLFLAFGLLLLLAGACNDHIANSADVVRSVALTDQELIGRTVVIPDLEGRRELHFSGTTKDDLSVPEQLVYCAGDISPAGALGENLRWQLDASGDLPVLRVADNRSYADYLIDSVATDRLYAVRRGRYDYHVQPMVLSVQPRRVVDLDGREAFFGLLNTGALQIGLQKKDSAVIVVRHRDNGELDGVYLYPPESLASLEMSFEPNGRYTIFGPDRVVRQGAFGLSDDGLWLVLDGGCAPTDYWRIVTHDPSRIVLEALIDLPLEVTADRTGYSIARITITVYEVPGAAAGAGR